MSVSDTSVFDTDIQQPSQTNYSHDEAQFPGKPDASYLDFNDGKHDLELANGMMSFAPSMVPDSFGSNAIPETTKYHFANTADKISVPNTTAEEAQQRLVGAVVAAIRPTLDKCMSDCASAINSAQRTASLVSALHTDSAASYLTPASPPPDYTRDSAFHDGTVTKMYEFPDNDLDPLYSASQDSLPLPDTDDPVTDWDSVLPKHKKKKRGKRHKKTSRSHGHSFEQQRRALERPRQKQIRDAWTLADQTRETARDLEHLARKEEQATRESESRKRNDTGDSDSNTREAARKLDNKTRKKARKIRDRKRAARITAQETRASVDYGIPSVTVFSPREGSICTREVSYRLPPVAPSSVLSV